MALIQAKTRRDLAAGGVRDRERAQRRRERRGLAAGPRCWAGRCWGARGAPRRVEVVALGALVLVAVVRGVGGDGATGDRHGDRQAGLELVQEAAEPGERALRRERGAGAVFLLSPQEVGGRPSAGGHARRTETATERAICSSVIENFLKGGRKKGE